MVNPRYQFQKNIDKTYRLINNKLRKKLNYSIPCEAFCKIFSKILRFGIEFKAVKPAKLSALNFMQKSGRIIQRRR